MNRSLMDVFSRGTKDQGRVMYDYVIGLYDFLERIVTRYQICWSKDAVAAAEDLTPEWCNIRHRSGAVIIQMHWTDYRSVWYIVWLSDIRCRFTCIGSTESSDRKNYISAYQRSSGNGWNIWIWTESRKTFWRRKEEIRSQVEEYRKFAPLIQTGLYYRLSDPSKEEYAAWAFVSEDQKEVLLNVVMQEIHGNMTVNYVNLQGLKCSAVYRDTETGKTYNGAALMEAGIPMPVEMGEFKAYQMHLVGEE